MRRVDVAVVGGGQAGLATSYHLAQHGIDHVILERGKVAESWRSRRWDSFALNAPNWAFILPGHRYAGDEPDAFMSRDELVREFSDYAARIGAPLEEGVEVTAVRRGTDDGTYLVETSARTLSSRAVVAATGAYQRRTRPPNADFAADIVQLDTDEYRNAQSLPDGGVLVIGSGQSGCQVAEDLLAAGRRVWLATGSCGWIPRRYRGRDNVRWRWDMGMFDDTVEQLGPALRLACPPIQTGVDGGRDLNLSTMRDAGAVLTGRFRAADGHTVTFADDLAANATGSDKVAIGIRQRIDEFVSDKGIDAPDEPPFEPVGDLGPAPISLDLAHEDIRTVIWATGFRLDFGWIKLDLGLTEQGYPEQVQGVSRHPGLCFMGLQLMHTRKSGLIFGVDEDAAHVAAHLRGHLDGA